MLWLRMGYMLLTRSTINSKGNTKISITFRRIWTSLYLRMTWKPHLTSMGRLRRCTPNLILSASSNWTMPSKSLTKILIIKRWPLNMRLIKENYLDFHKVMHPWRNCPPSIRSSMSWMKVRQSSLWRLFSIMTIRLPNLRKKFCNKGIDRLKSRWKTRWLSIWKSSWWRFWSLWIPTMNL